MQPELVRSGTLLTAIVATIVVVAIAGSIVILGLSGDASAEVERQVRHAIAVDDAALHAKGIANDQRGYLLSGNEQFLATIAARTELARIAFEEAERTADGGQRDAVMRAREGFEEWIGSMSQTLAMYRAGDVEAAVDHSLGEGRELRKAYEEALIEADAHAVDTMRDVPDWTASVRRSLPALVAYVVVVVAIGAVATFVWIDRTRRRAGSET